MTYWSAVRSFIRRDQLTAHEQIMRNLDIAIGNIKFSIVCVVIVIIETLVKTFHL